MQGLKLIMNVIGRLVIVGFLFASVTPYISDFMKDSFGGRVEFEASEEEIQLTLKLCRNFYDESFIKENYEKTYHNSFEMFFSESNLDTRYAQTKLLCGALIEIYNDAKNSKNIETTISTINEDYSVIFPGLEFDSEEIQTIISENDEIVWVGLVINELTEEIKKEVSN